MMNNPEDGELERWSERHFGELAFWRTVGQAINILLTSINIFIVVALFKGWI
jgi:hypothetical protein